MAGGAAIQYLATPTHRGQKNDCVPVSPHLDVSASSSTKLLKFRPARVSLLSSNIDRELEEETYYYDHHEVDHDINVPDKRVVVSVTTVSQH